MSECNHVKVAKQSLFFPWIKPEDDDDIKYYDKDEADKCPNCKNK